MFPPGKWDDQYDIGYQWRGGTNREEIPFTHGRLGNGYFCQICVKGGCENMTHLPITPQPPPPGKGLYIKVLTLKHHHHFYLHFWKSYELLFHFLIFFHFWFLIKQGCCKPVTLSAIGHISLTGQAAVRFQSYLGTYAPIRNPIGNAPIYGKIGGEILMRQSDGTWIVAKGIGEVVDIKSNDAAPCPYLIRHWSYRRGQRWSKTGSVTVKCS